MQAGSHRTGSDLTNGLVIMRDRKAVTSSLTIADTFEKDHRHVLRDIDNLQKDVPNFGQMFSLGDEPDSYGRPRRVYYMNRDGFTLLAMGFTGQKAFSFKLKYIEAFNSMETQITTGFTIPGTYAEALKLAASQAEQLELQRPKVVFADAVAVSHTTILVGELAKLLRQNGVDIGQNRLFSWLRQHGYLSGRHGSSWNQPTQRSVEAGLFKVKETTINHSDGRVEIVKTTKVTGKGQQYFINKFLNQEGEISYE